MRIEAGSFSARRMRISHAAAFVLAAALVLAAIARTLAVAPEGDPFRQAWERTDKPVADHVVNRTWMWGPEAFTDGMFEPYLEGHNNGRFVQYFDKSRMEISTEQNLPADSPWFVTNGLLVVELMTGRLQLGDNTFEQHNPATINVAGDPDDISVPTYSTFALLMNDDPLAEGAMVVQKVDRFGNVSSDPTLASKGVSAAVHVAETDHTVASVFWNFMTSSGTVYENGQFVTDNLFVNPYYATGFPVTEAFWTTVKVAGVYRDVLVQAFERRVLTYTPDNPDGWKVETGNVGRHYYDWRYTQIPGEVTPTPTSTPATPTATATSTSTATEESTVTASPTATSTATATATSTTIQGTTGLMRIETILPALPSDPQAQNEYIIIRNMQISGDIQMEGWKLRDLDGNTFVFPNVVVKAGFYVTVYVCSGQNIIEPRYAYLYWGRCSPFYTPPDTVQLIDSFGNVVTWYPPS